jgi:hypothetical protein
MPESSATNAVSYTTLRDTIDTDSTDGAML